MHNNGYLDEFWWRRIATEKNGEGEEWICGIFMDMNCDVDGWRFNTMIQK